MSCVAVGVFVTECVSDRVMCPARVTESSVAVGVMDSCVTVE